MKLKKLIENLLLLLFCSVVLIFSIRGIPGNPKAEELDSPKWRNSGPIEQTGRFALLYSIVEDNSFQLSLPLARFSTPDLVTINGKYVALFAPGVSFIAIPGYLIGKSIGFAQVGAFAVISLFALSNIFLIRGIAMKMGVNSIAATIGGITFAFATPAFAYGVDFYQHHISTFFILFSIYSLLYFSDFIALIIVWFCFGASIVVDYPNFLMMLPIGIYAVKRLFVTRKIKNAFGVELNLFKIFTFVAAILPLVFFLWFNQMSYGNPFILSAALPRVTAIDADGKPANLKKPAAVQAAINNATQNQIKVFSTFNPRLMLNGFYVHFFSPDRGMLSYTPVMFFGFIGAVIALRAKARFATLLAYVAGINILVYSMWADPWGGWAFGSRYLIPAYAILSIFIAYLIFLMRRKSIFLVVFLGIVAYSVAVNTLGALTSSLNPPEVEAVVIAREAGHEFKYTYARNIDFLNSQGSKALIFRVAGINYLSSWDYYIDITVFILMAFSFLLVYNRVAAEKERV